MTRLKRANAGTRVCALVSFVVLCAVMALAAAPALALNPERHYELVSPVYKGGYGANRILAVAPGGESVVFKSLGAFAGTPSVEGTGGGYVARRGASGWSTASLLPPSTMVPAGAGLIEGFSTDLASTLFVGALGPDLGAAHAQATEWELLVHRTAAPDTEANWEVAGMVLKALGERPFGVTHVHASTGLCHFIFEASEPLLSSAVKAYKQLYDLSVCGEGAPSLRLIAVKNGSGPEPAVIDPYCAVLLGGPESQEGLSRGATRRSTFNALAADGQEIFFTTNANTSIHSAGECEGSGGSPTEFPANRAILYARLGGQRTLQISAPIPADCAVSAPCHTAAQQRGEFQGASADGSRVFFTTTQPLVTEDTQVTNNLYVATLGCPGGEEEVCEPAQREVTSLVRASKGVGGGEAAQVQGVVAVSPDASRAYFVARGALGGEPNAQGQSPRVGADNLYVYERDAAHPEGHTAFVDDLCSGAGRSGEVEDSSCPLAKEGHSDSKLWASHEPEAQTAGTDGRFLVFTTYAQLVSNDTDTARDVYLYDAQTGALDRVSHGEAGHDANGNNSEFDARISGVFTDGREFEQARTDTRAISEDGTRVVFTTSEPLSEDAINHLANVYEWHREPGEAGEGHVSLISPGDSSELEDDAVITPSGRDVFFITAKGLAPEDTDGQPDVYDARLGGGFPPRQAEPEHCSGEACYGPLTNPAPLLVPGSVPQTPGENVAVPGGPAPNPAVRSKARLVRCKKAFVRKKGKCVRKAKQKRAKKAKRAGRVK